MANSIDLHQMPTRGAPDATVCFASDLGLLCLLSPASLIAPDKVFFLLKSADPLHTSQKHAVGSP